MALVDEGDIVRIACRQSYDTGGQDIINVIHLLCEVQQAVFDADVVDNVGEAIELIFDAVRLVQSNTHKFTTLEMKNLTQDILIGVTSWPTFVAGADANAVASPQVTALSILKTQKSRVLGRINWPGIPETFISAGLLHATFLAAMADAQTVVLTDLVTTLSVYDYIVYNREFGTWNRANGSVAIIPTRSQKRRSHGFGT